MRLGTKERILTIRLLEKMEHRPNYAEKFGIEFRVSQTEMKRNITDDGGVYRKDV